MLALIAAVLLALDAFGVAFAKVDVFKLALACWAAHFCLVVPIPVPTPRRRS